MTRRRHDRRHLASSARKRAPIVHRERVNQNHALRISGGDSRKKPVLASDDETRSRFTRKIFFIAKNRDSESAQRRLSRHRSVAPTSIACRSFVMRSAKTPAASAFLSISTTKCVAFSRVARIVVPIHWGVVDERVSPLPARARQYFLKQDAVFLDVLVYSGCSAFRFPSARSD